MRSLSIIFLLASFLLFLSGCNSTTSLTNTQGYSSDDIDVIENIWPQALDQMLLWLDVPVVEQTPVVAPAPSYSPSLLSKPPVVKNPVVEQAVVQQPVMQQPVIIPSVSPFVENNRERDDDYEDDD